MKFVIQRVQHASVSAEGKIAGSIGKGLLVLVGIGFGDTEETADKMVRKLCSLRIFEDEGGKTNLSVTDVGGAVLIVSQFTLYADVRRGNRPSFTNAAPPDEAERLYGYVAAKVRETVPEVGTGIFGADMKVELLNDGPFTIILDSEEIIRR